MKNFTRIQQITLITGCIGLTINALSLALQNEPAGYLALCLGRLSGLFYMVCLDRFRFYYLFPLFISGANVAINSEFMTFAELLASSIIYQISAFHTFNKKH
jgi:hypothetical protein